CSYRQVDLRPIFVKKWIEEMYLKAGDQVTLMRELDNSLSIAPIPARSSESLNEVIVVIMPNDSSNTLRRRWYRFTWQAIMSST
ncbi:MAG: hypothetical protein M3239_06435, partial [Thermoproteota archaeon]|nr:hypothetical protein [Thermoproteota archaeon]